MITQTNERFFSKAYELALLGEHHRVKVGALASVKGTPIAGGFNTIRNQTTNGVSFKAHTRHAEWNCIHMLPVGLRSKCTLYVARVNKHDLLRPSRPCGRCMQLIQNVGIKEVVFWDQTIQKVFIPRIWG